MSPLSDFEAGVAVIDRHPAFEAFVELDFGSGEAEAPGPRRDLEAASLPLHDVVAADGAFMHEAADAIEFGRRGPPRVFDLVRRAAEAAVVVGQEAAQDFVSGAETGGPGQTQFAGEAVLEGAPQALTALAMGGGAAFAGRAQAGPSISALPTSTGWWAK